MLDHPVPYTMLAGNLLASGQQRSVEDVGKLSSHDIIGRPPLPLQALLKLCLLVPITGQGSVLPAGIRAPMSPVRLRRKPTSIPPI